MGLLRASLWIAGGLMLVGIVGNAYENATDTRTPSERREDRRLDNIKWRGITNVKYQLRDPSSAEFQGVYVSSRDYVCGSINGRNGFGGMTGWQRFITGTVGRVVLEETYRDGPYAFEEHWNSHCQRSAPRVTQKVTPKPTKTTTPTTTTRPADPWRAIAVTEPQL